MREMAGSLGRGQSVVITPDGPRGPRHGMNIGLAWLARETGLPIVCLGVGCDRGWRLKSWDRFLVPKPFARIAVTYGAPIVVRSDAGEADLVRATEDVRRTLLAIEERAFAAVGAEKDF